MQTLDFSNLDWERINLKIPKEDYINSNFDYTAESPLKNILVLFSTPRSGSTLLCDMLYKNNICIPHEYFQIDDYLPLLAKQWGCIKNNALNKQQFINNLIKKRTSPKGWLGINLHGEHLPIFSSFKAFFPEVNYHYIHIVRDNSLSQAISYEIAIQTGKWSSFFNSNIEPEYSYKGIENKLHRINEQNNLIKSYIQSNKIDCMTLHYEDLAKNPISELSKIFSSSILDNVSAETSLKKQSSSINNKWLETFSREYLEVKTQPNQITSKNKQSFFGKIFSR
jgi:LPS sulfotransferase NodH